MNHETFDSIAERAVLFDHCPSGFAAAVVTEMDAGRLSPLATARILLETPSGGGWSGLRFAVIADLIRHPHDATQVLNLITSRLQWPAAIVGSTTRDGPSHAPVFTVSISMDVPHDGQFEAVASASSIKLARQRASVRLLAKLADVTAPEFEPTPTGVTPAAIPSNGNAISWLYEYAAKASPKLRQPSFRPTAVASGFMVRCLFVDRETEGVGSTKQAAKLDAAMKMEAEIKAPI